MKRIFTLLIFFAIIISSSNAQERYLDEVFDDVQITSNVVYGVNATVILVPSVGEAVPQPLTMDIYEPMGDTETSRPVVLVFHTGNFLPNVTNGAIAGTKEDNASIEICTQLAKRGYVAASVTYRGGWNPLADSQPIRVLGLIQAAYRGIQDGRTAIRYMRVTAADDNPYGIDDSKIAVWGNGTGGYLTLGLATLDKYEEITSTTNGPAKFILDLNGDGIPETPMVVEAYHGDVEGKNLTIAPDGAFGLPAGDTTNYPNHVDFSSDISLCINIGGALADISWIDSITSPIITVQSAFDIFAPYGDAVLIVPNTGDPVVQVQGGSIFQPVLHEAGVNTIWDDFIFDDAITQEARDNSVTAGHPYYEGLFPWVMPANSNGLDEGVVVNWWDPNALSPPIPPNFPNGVPWNMLPHPSGGTFHDQGLLLNEGMSAEKSRANIDKIMSYVMPRTCVALRLPCADLFTGIKDINLDPSIMTIAPNPASTSINISALGENIETIAIFAMDGKLMMKESNVNSESITIQRNNLPTGIYFVKAFFEKGVATQKVVFE